MHAGAARVGGEDANEMARSNVAMNEFLRDKVVK